MNKCMLFLMGILLSLILLNSCEFTIHNTTTDTTMEITTIDDKNQYDEYLSRSYISPLSEEIIGPDTDCYIIFVYSTYCGHCHKVLTSDEYQLFTQNPRIRLYLINGSDMAYDFFDFVHIEYVPTMIYIEKKEDNTYEVSRYTGSPDCIDFLGSYIE